MDGPNVALPDSTGSSGVGPSIATRAARFEQSSPRVGRSRPLLEPIVQSTVFAFDDLTALEEYYTQGGPSDHIYYRYGHPNAAALERLMADLEGATDAIATASGMAAITALVMATCSPGDHVLIQEGAYGGTYALARGDLARWGIDVSFVAGDAATIRAALTDRTRLVLLEALTNPLLRVADVPAVATITRERGCLLAVDSSFASPALFRPIEHGADVVLHSIAKYLGGHSAAMGGLVAGGGPIVGDIRRVVATQGASLGPFDAWMAAQGVRTLALRMRAHAANALAVARWLAERHDVRRVHHPGLPEHPDFTVAKRLLPDGCGGMVAFDLADGAAARAFLGRVATAGIPFSPSLADVRTTVSYPTATSHRALAPAERAAAGIGDGLIRLSVGIEDVADIIASLDQALA